MTVPGVTSKLLILLALAALACPWAEATEVYRWTDENGVVHFSQTPPPPSESEVSKLALDDTRPADYDPEADIYGVAAQQERMKALREEMEKKRQGRERQAPMQNVTPYRDRTYLNYPIYGYPGYYPRPPYRPNPPIERPRPRPGDPIRPPRPIQPPSPLRPR